jgi:uncharacterized protein YbbC (DUF1343 family)
VLPQDEILAVLPGAEAMREYLPMLEGRRVGLVVNQTSLVSGVHLADTLLKRNIRVVRILTPEHGFRGTADAGEHIRDERDVQTGIPIISLYGDKKKPQDDDLAELDVLVFDIQDVGVRFYTYISTLHYIMEAAGANNIPLIILDRPNPNGHYVDGPVLDTVGYRSFVGMHPIPVVYGLTMGELATMILGEAWINERCNLTVIECKNYTHQKSYQLPVRPSPNLPNQRAVLLYPGLCFFEGTVASLGRGTDFPFQVAGHPDFPDTSFSFIPRSMPGAKFPPLENKKCYGVNLTHIDEDSLFNTKQINMSVLLEFYQKLSHENFFNASWFDKLAGGPGYRTSIEAGMTEHEIRATWKEDLDQYSVMRRKYLLYPDFE